jgi:hypothetical protein
MTPLATSWPCLAVLITHREARVHMQSRKDGFGAVVPSAGLPAGLQDGALFVADWGPCIIELSFVAIKIYEHRQLLWSAMPSWAQLRAQPEAWAFIGLQLSAARR